MKLFRSAWLVSVLGLLVASSAFAQTTNGRVTAAAPTYAAGTAPFSLTTGGGLRVDIASIAATLGIVGTVAHDGAGAAVSPVLTGCYASAAAPSDVSADNDATREWCLRNGARASVLTAAGALIGGDAANGLDVDVTRLPALVAGAAIIGKVGIDQTTPGTTNLVQVTDGAGALNVIVDSITAGANVIGKVSIDQTTPGTTNLVQITDGSGAVNVIVDSSATLTVNTHAVTVASGGIASGAVASGAYASGAFASGAFASGAYASGSIAAGAVAAGATSFVKLEDVGSADADAGVPAMCTRKATAANVSGSDGDYEFLQCSAGRLWASATIDAALPAGTALIGQVNAAPQTTGGATLYTLTAANSTNATNVKASAGQIYNLAAYNNSATLAWLSLYNNSGTPTCGTSIIQQYMIPASSGFNLDFSVGKAFSSGIAFCVTTGIAGTGSVAASAYVINIDYK